MNTKTPEQLAKILVEAGFTASEPITGCSDSDIEELEQRYNVKLPSAYTEFLRVMGRKAGNFLTDGSWLYPLEYARQEALAHIEAEESDFILPSTEFVFLTRDNFFLSFDTTCGDDPPVRIFEDGSREPRHFFDSFSSWLTTCVENDAKNRIKYDQARQARNLAQS